MLIRVNKLVSGTSIRKNVEVRVENKKIAAITPAGGQAVDLESEYLTPGFVDIHCHGGNGTHFFDSEPKAAEKSAEFHLKHGTTSLIASFIAAPIVDLREQIHGLVRQLPLLNIVGVHLEGPYLSEIFCGAHNPDFLSNPNVTEVKTLLNDGAGWIKMITIAPELPGALETISYLKSQGVVAAIGHSDADDQTTKSAIDAGASMVTHFFSAMGPIHHRISGMTLTTLFDERVNLELILDNVHIAPNAIKIPLNFATERIIGITDALAFAGLADGDYLLGTTNVELRNGIAKIKDKDLLAGSTLTMDKSFKSAVTNLGFSPIEAVQAFCQRPASVMKLTNVGEIAVGKDADLLLMDQDFNLQKVIFKGSLV
jgi:N-acetylglucosamine-6-phosphate deacetylase